MVAMKLLGVIVATYLFVVREVFAQNFYPARYGKRDENDFQGDPLLEGRRLGRSDDQNTLTDRKIRFFISGGRYGKRGCSSENCSGEGPKEAITSTFESDQDQNERISIPSRKSQFMVGSRFGKRLDDLTAEDAAQSKGPWCVFTRLKSYYRCLVETDPKDLNQLKILYRNNPNEVVP